MTQRWRWSTGERVLRRGVVFLVLILWMPYLSLLLLLLLLLRDVRVVLLLVCMISWGLIGHYIPPSYR